MKFKKIIINNNKYDLLRVGSIPVIHPFLLHRLVAIDKHQARNRISNFLYHKLLVIKA